MVIQILLEGRAFNCQIIFGVLMFVSCYKMCFPHLLNVTSGFSKKIYFHCTFKIFDYNVDWHVCVFMYLSYFRLIELLNLEVYTFPQIWQTFSHYFFIYLFIFTSALLAPKLYSCYIFFFIADH